MKRIINSKSNDETLRIEDADFHVPFFGLVEFTHGNPRRYLAICDKETWGFFSSELQSFSSIESSLTALINEASLKKDVHVYQFESFSEMFLWFQLGYLPKR